jgi:integrative and conjugative element protein (TIGR02256 family)
VSASVSGRAAVYQEWRSRDRKFGVAVEQRHIQQLVDWCIEAGDQETGGILIGRYSDRLDLAVVSRVSGPPPDSRRGRTFFERGTRGLQRLLDRAWQRRSEYYLGEWHFHPGSEGIPSRIDRDQMATTARLPSFRCPEPILLIVGGRPTASRSIRAFAYPNGQQVELEAPAQLP